MEKDVKKINDVFENILDLKKTIFLNFLKKSFFDFIIKEKIKNKSEIELNFLNPNIECMSILFNNDKKIINSYIEISYFKDETKYRIRKNISFLDKKDISKKDFINELKNETWEKKKKINEEKFEYFKITHSKEDVYNNIDIYNEKINIELVNSIKIENEYFISEFKLKSKLENNKYGRGFLNSYFDRNNYNKIKTLEIELKKNITIDKNIFDELFDLIIVHTFGVPTNLFIFYYNDIYDKIKTNMVDLSEIYNLNPNIYLITKKIDGEFTQFIIYNNYCYVLRNGIIIKMKCDIDKDVFLIGSGEYTYKNNYRYLFIFHIEVFKIKNKDIKFDNKQKMFNFLKKKNLDLKLDNSKKTFSLISNKKIKKDINIKIKIKNFEGPFDTKKDLLYKIIEYYNKTDTYPSDGIILTCINNNNIPDLKFKQSNTVDVFTYITLQNTDILIINFCLVNNIKFKNMIIKKKSINILISKEIQITEEIYFDNKLFMFVYYNKEKKINYLLPLIFISEYYYDKHEFIPRLDKTNMMYNNSKNITYFGNSTNVVLKSLVLYESENYIKNNQLEIILKNYDDKKLNDFFENYENMLKDFITEKKNNILKEEEINKDSVEEYKKTNNVKFVCQPLNYGKKWYKETDKNNRSSLNLLSNLNKTYGLYNINPIINNKHYKTVLSIYCGKGGDMGKFVANDITHVLGIEPDINSTNTFKNRLEEYNRKKQKNFDLQIMNLYLEDCDFIKKVKDNIKFKFNTFDIIDIQLGLHFSLNKKTENHIMNILTTFSDFEKSTMVFISVNDGDNIKSLFEKKNTNKNDILKLKIDKDVYYNIKYDDDKISVLYDLSMDNYINEYIMYKDYLIELFKKNNYILKQTWTFDKILSNDMKEIYKNMEEFYERFSSKKFLQDISKIDFENNDLIDVLSIFRYYIFEYKK